MMTILSCALKKHQPGGAGSSVKKERGDGSSWWTTIHGSDQVEGESPATPKMTGNEPPVTPKTMTGNRLINVEELASVGSLSSSSTTSSARAEMALDDFVTYLQENGVINGITVQQHLQNWKEGRGKELLDSSFATMSKIPFELHESRTGMASRFSWKCMSNEEYEYNRDAKIWSIQKKRKSTQLNTRKTCLVPHNLKRICALSSQCR
jgi:hypothetical protein